MRFLNRIFPEHAGCDAHLSTETVDKVFLAVIPCGVGDFTHRLPGGGEKVFCPVDTAQDDVFIGRVAGAGLELPGKVGRA